MPYGLLESMGGTTAPRALLAACFQTWRPEDGIPKAHLSSQVPDGPIGAHADWVEPNDAEALLEAKSKDRALLQLRAELEWRGIVEQGCR